MSPQIILQFFEFARQIKLDTILQEDWSDIISEHPFSTTEAVDREGAPGK